MLTRHKQINKHKHFKPKLTLNYRSFHQSASASPEGLVENEEQQTVLDKSSTKMKILLVNLCPLSNNAQMAVTNDIHYHFLLYINRIRLTRYHV